MWLRHFPAISAGQDAHIWKVIGFGRHRGQSGRLFAIFGDNRLAIVGRSAGSVLPWSLCKCLRKVAFGKRLTSQRSSLEARRALRLPKLQVSVVFFWYRRMDRMNAIGDLISVRVKNFERLCSSTAY